MIVDLDKKYVFVAIAKTACTSIHRRMGYDKDPVPEIYHMSMRDIKKSYEVENFYKFAFVRNPYDRLVSAFYNFRFDRGHSKWAHPIYRFDTFRDFVLGFENSPCINFIHLQTQFDFLETGGEVKMDFVGRYENLREDFKKVEKDLGLPHVNLPVTRVQDHPPYQGLYDEETKRIVRRVYKDDFETFGYEQ
tara:strand:- start:4636 stop:5208 length:573 start_codon:yes stop_codon:yes gene_type:complete